MHRYLIIVFKVPAIKNEKVPKDQINLYSLNLWSEPKI